MTADAPPSESPPQVDVALCVDPLTVRRFRAVLRHLCVGLVDAAAAVRLVTSSPEAESLVIGSTQLVVHRDLS